MSTQKHRKTSVIVRRANPLNDGDQRSESVLVECPICSELTAKYIHYGGIACDSCKAFFRRTVVNPSKKSEMCRIGNGKCSLKRERRNNCPYCRFQLCIQSGMKPNMIKIRRTQYRASTSVIRETNLEVKIPPELRIELTDEEMIEQIVMYHHHILTQTSGVNIMTIPAKFLGIVEERIQKETEIEETKEKVLGIAQLELHFLKAKQNLLENKSIEQLFQHQNSSDQIFTVLHEVLLEMVIMFLKECKFFQALTWECTSRLLRKNITDITVLLMVMSFDTRLGKFRWLVPPATSPKEVDRTLLNKYLKEYIAEDIYEFVTSFTQLEIPGHVLVVLILICFYSRDGLLMKKQEKIDNARNFYQLLLFRYIKGTNPEEDSSRLNATLHRALKTVKDFGEKMRSFEIFQTKIHSI